MFMILIDIKCYQCTTDVNKNMTRAMYTYNKEEWDLNYP